MTRKIIYPLLVVAMALGMLSGCGENSTSPQPAQPPARKAVAPPAKRIEAPSVPTEETSAPSYSYDPAGRRDPFEPPVMVKRPLSQSNEPLTPLQKYDLDQLRLIGVIIGKGVPSAMVVAPDGKSYILQKGTKVGKNNGVVVRIKQDSVVVQETYYDFSGEVRKNDQEIQLPKREGV
jgi:type IV pilus assembly protein PilP